MTFDHFGFHRSCKLLQLQADYYLIDWHLTEHLRIAGQSIFLAFSVFLVLSVLFTINEQRQRGDAMKSRRLNIALLLVTFASLFLLVRGIWGVLQASDPSLSVSCFAVPLVVKSLRDSKRKMTIYMRVSWSWPTVFQPHKH